MLAFKKANPDVSTLSGDYIAEFVVNLRNAFISIRRQLHQSLVYQIETMTSFYYRDDEAPLLLDEKTVFSYKERAQRRDNRHIAVGIAQKRCDEVIQQALEVCIEKVMGISSQSPITLEELSQYRAEQEEFYTQSYLKNVHILQAADREREDTYLIPDGKAGEVRARAIRDWITQVTTASDRISDFYQPLFAAARTDCLQEVLEKLVSDKGYQLTTLMDSGVMLELTQEAHAQVKLHDIHKKLQYALEAYCLWSNTRFGADEETIFHLVAKTGSCKLITYLSELARHTNFEEPNFLDHQDNQGNTVFHAAMSADQYQCAITLIGYDINLMLCNTAGVKAYNACDSQGNGLAHYAAVTNNFDWMSIIAATQLQSHDQSVLSILDHFLKQANAEGDTALHLVWHDSNFEATCALLYYGANPRIANHRGEVPFEMLNNTGDTYAIEAYRRNQKALIDQFYDACPECITALNREGHTLLGLSLEKGDYDYALHLIRYCNANFFDIHETANIPVYQLRNTHDGATLLHHLIRKGAHADAFYLIGRGVDPRIEDGDGQPAYKIQDPKGLPIAHLAIKYREYESFVKLINAGVVNPDDENQDGDSLWTMLLDLVNKEQSGEKKQSKESKQSVQNKKSGKQKGTEYSYLDFQKFITLIMVNYHEAQRRYKQKVSELEDTECVEQLLEPRLPLAFNHLEPNEIDFSARVEAGEEIEAAVSLDGEVQSPMDKVTVHLGTGQRQWSHLQRDAIDMFGDIGDAEMSSNLKAWDRIRHRLITRDQCRKFLERKRAFLKQLISETCISTIVSHMAEDDLDLTQRLQAVSKQKNKNMPPALLHESRSLHFNATNIPGFGLGVDYRTMALRSKAETHRADMQTERAEEQTQRAETLTHALVRSHLQSIGLVYQDQATP